MASPAKYVVPNELYARCAGRLDLVQRVLDAYARQMQDDLPQLNSELESGNLPGVARLAHRIKGASANAAMPSLRDSAEAVERLAHENCQAEIPAVVAQLEADWRSFESSTAELRNAAP